MKRLLSTLFSLVLASMLLACGTARIRSSTDVFQSAPSPKAEAIPADTPDFAPDYRGLSDFDRGTYANPYFGFGMKAGKGIQLLDPGSFPGGAGCLLYARSSDGLSLIFLFAEEIGEDADPAEYLTGQKGPVSDLQREKELDDVKSVTGTVFFAGADRPCLYISGTVEGVKVYERYICVKNGPYISVISLASFTEDRTFSLSEMFYTIDEP